jgi:hypothetical protein
MAILVETGNSGHMSGLSTAANVVVGVHVVLETKDVNSPGRDSKV